MGMRENGLMGLWGTTPIAIAKGKAQTPKCKDNYRHVHTGAPHIRKGHMVWWCGLWDAPCFPF